MIDIHYTGEGLEKKLSNLYPYRFEIDGVIVESMEGFLQSLKCKNIDNKKTLWGMHGYKCWKYGQSFNQWKDDQLVYWNGQKIDRQSDEYTKLIERAFDCLFQNQDFKENLRLSLKDEVDHSKGKTDKKDSLLTKKEYIDNLNRLRDKLRPKRFYDLFNLFNK